MKKYILLATVALIVVYINCGGNNPPDINDIIVTPDTVNVGDVAHLSVDADDEDGDDLDFSWTASAGNLSATTGEEVDWTAPNDTGTYDITVEADDGNGGEDSFTKSIPVYGSSDYWLTDSNTTTYPIYDLTTTWSYIDIAGAPTGARTDSIEVTVDITHSYPADLEIAIFAESDSGFVLWAMGDFPGGLQSIRIRPTAGWKQLVNGQWRLGVYDGYAGDEGSLNKWIVTMWWDPNL